MKRLFIFGNGFDIAHNIPTRYSDFRQWLIEMCGEYDEDFIFDYELPSYETNYKGLESYNEAKFAEFFLRLIDEASVEDDEWQSFENTLGKLNWNLVLANANNEYDDEGDIDPWKTETNHTAYAQNCSETNHILKRFFHDWVDGVNVEIEGIKPLSDFQKINFSDDDLFFTFNYTDTLEVVYGVKNVVHLHGRVSNYQTLVLGHGIERFVRNNDDPIDDNAHDIFEAIFNGYKKDTDYVLKNHCKDFKKLSNVDVVCVFGFSFGDVDDAYFRKIFSENGIRKLVLNVYEDERYDTIKDKIIKLGFNGEILNWKNIEDWKNI